MIDQGTQHQRGKHRYTSVVEGMELANEFARSRLAATEFARQRGVSPQMVRYWSGRARRLATASRGDLVQVADVLPNGAVETRTPALPGPEPKASSPLVTPAASAPSAPPSIEVRLPNGIRIGIGAGFSPEVLSQVISCIGGRPC